MKEDFERLNNERKLNVEKTFAAADGKQQFFLHLLDGFSHRYITDEKFPQPDIQILSKSHFKATNKLETMKRALELVDSAQKLELVNQMKESVGKIKPTTEFNIEIDASGLNSDGKGIVRSKCSVDWGFPSHNKNAAFISEKKFDSEDWDHLRKEFPLVLDSLCELF